MFHRANAGSYIDNDLPVLELVGRFLCIHLTPSDFYLTMANDFDVVVNGSNVKSYLLVNQHII